MSTFDLGKKPPCPCCAEPLNGATGVGHEQVPEPGDWTVCIYCLEPLAFTEDFGLRRLTAAELDAARADPDMRAVFCALAEISGVQTS